MTWLGARTTPLVVTPMDCPVTGSLTWTTTTSVLHAWIVTTTTRRTDMDDEWFPDTDPDWVDEQVLGEEYEANK